VLDDVRERFGVRVFEPPVPKSVRFAEAPGRGVSILEHAPASKGAEAYRSIARTLDAEWHGVATPCSEVAWAAREPAEPLVALGDDDVIALDDLTDRPRVDPGVGEHAHRLR
jgi:hypothetical protein